VHFIWRVIKLLGSISASIGKDINILHNTQIRYRRCYFGSDQSKIEAILLESNVRPRLYLGRQWRDFSENSHLSRDQVSGHVVRNFILYYVVTAFIVEYSSASYCRRQEKDLSVGGRIILKCIFKKWDETWTGLV